MTTVPAVPGLRGAGAHFLWALSRMTDRAGLSLQGVATVISHESRFKPDARNPSGTASGLLQFTDRTAQHYGTTADAILGMTAEEQLPYIEQFFRTTIPRSARWEDYMLATLGRGDLAGKSDDVTVYAGPSAAYAGQAREFDMTGKGYITVGDVRNVMRNFLANNASGTLQVPDTEPTLPDTPLARGGSGLPIAIALFAVGAVIVKARK